MALQTRFARAENSTGLMLWRVTNQWQAAQRAALRPFDLTHVQFVLLASLAYLPYNEQPVTQRDLAEHARTDVMMTSQVLRTLEHKQLVERRPHPRDARARILAPTAPGLDLANRAVAAVEGTDRRFFESLDADRAVFTDLLNRLDRRDAQSVPAASRS